MMMMMMHKGVHVRLRRHMHVGWSHTAATCCCNDHDFYQREALCDNVAGDPNPGRELGD